MKTQANKQTVSCPKCSGKGRIEAFTATANGKCFACWGAGTVETDKPSAKKALIIKTNCLIYQADSVLESADNGRDDLADHTLGRMVADMFQIGTANARKVLDYLANGSYRRHDDDVACQIDRATAQGIARKLVKLGKEAR